MRGEGKAQGEGTSKKNQKGSQVRNEGASECCSAGKTPQSRVGVWRSSNFTERKRPYLFTPQGTVENALFRTAALTLAYRMPSVRNRGADPLGSHSRTPVLLAGSSLLHLLAFT